MKKSLNIVLLLLLVFSLTSCFGKDTSNDVEDVKKDLLNPSNSGSVVDENIPKYEDTLASTGANTGDKVDTTNTQNAINTEKYSVKYLGDKNFIEIDNLDKGDFTNRKVEITGKTLVNVDKILVSFSNKTSSFPDDNQYKLSQFKAGDKTFLYRAFSQYQTLDYGTNEYIIEAYSGEEVARVEIIINIQRNETTINSEEKTNTQTNTGSYQSLNDTSTDINGLTIKEITPDLSVATADDINEFLTNNLEGNAYFYWNSLRPIKNNIGASFYTITLDGANYTYSKHYYVPNGSYGVLTLETGTGIDKENIAEKNVEFKNKNGDFDTSATDEYFRNLIDM